MNPTWKSERTEGFTSSLSKIPRWCRPKIAPRPMSSSCMQFTTGDIQVQESPSPNKLPPIYTKDEFTSICEPPSLNASELQAVWKAKQDRLNANEKLQETAAHADFLKQELKEVKEKIEKISRQLESPLSADDAYLEFAGESEESPLPIDAFLEFAGESEDRDRNPEQLYSKNNRTLQQELESPLPFIEFAGESEAESPLPIDPYLEFAGESEVRNPEQFYPKNNRQLQQELLKAVDQEDNLTQQLEIAHRRLWEARVGDNSLIVEVESKLSPAIEAYDIRREFASQKRTFREKQVKQSAKLRRSQTFRIAAQTLVESSAVEMRRKNQIARNAINARDARQRIAHHLKKSMKRRKDQKLAEVCDEQTKQFKQHKSLSHLKTEIDEHRSLLMAQNAVRQVRLKKIEEEKEKIRQDFIRNGKNPYFIEHLLLIEERRTQAHRKILQQEADRLMELQKDYEASERVKYRTEYHKQKWDRFWATKFEEKKQERLRKEEELFLRDEFNLMPGKNDATEKDACVDEKSQKSQKQDGVKRKSKSTEEAKSRPNRNSLSKNDGAEELSGDVKDLGLDISPLPDKKREEFVGGVEIKIFQQQDLPNERGDQEKCLSEKIGKPTTPAVKEKIPARRKLAGAKPSFRCHPSVITFSDFEVGKIYKKTLTITNISKERLKVSLKEFVNLSSNVAPAPQLSFEVTESDDSQPPAKVDTKVDTKVRNVAINELVKVKNPVSKPLSAGLAHEVQLTFTPQSLADSSGQLIFDSAVESFQVLVECLSKRFIPQLSPSKAVFTNVISTTSAFLIVKVVNKGAKPGIIQHLEQSGGVSSYFENDYQNDNPSDLEQESFDPNNNPELDSKTDKPLTTASTSSQKDLVRNILEELVTSVTDGIFLSYFKECNRQLGDHETRNLVIFFRPPSIDTYKTRFELQFDDPDVKNLILDVEGTSTENPIFIDPMASDLKICMMDNCYQQIVTLSTTIRGAGKVVPQVPFELRHFVQIYPKKAALFAKNPAKFTVKFLPRAAILQNHSKALRYIDLGTKILDFPILFQLSFPCKVQSPVGATIMAILTNQSLEFTPQGIDMGKCSLTETVQSAFEIVNNCMLPQEIGFVGLPPCIMIQPNYGFATLLPFERRQFDIFLTLPGDASSGDLSFSLKCQTLQQRQYFLEVRAFSKPSPVQLSTSRILFPATPVGSDAVTSIQIFSEDQRMIPKFEFVIDPEFPIKITPKAGYLMKGVRLKLFVEFQATVSDIQVQQHLEKLLGIEYVHNQATLQRELEGINQTLKQEMVLEDELNPEFKGTSNKTQNKDKSRKIGSKKNSKSDPTKATNDKKSFVQEAYKALERRRLEVMNLLETPFKPPDPTEVQPEDFSRAKHDFVKRMTTTSQQYSIPCFVTSPDGEVDVLTLNVKGVVSAPNLIVLEESNTIDFNGVGGSASYGEIHLYNVSSSGITPKIELLNPLGPFLLCNAIRNIPPDHVFALKFRFLPKEAKSFSETIGVRGGGSHFTLTLRGSCT